MAKMIDQKSSYHGEGMVWESIKKNLPDYVIAYNNREVNGREYDFCLLVEHYGILIIEVKGWLAEKIKVEAVDRIWVEGYDDPQHSPKKQANNYRFAILNKLNKKYNKSPLVLSMVSYPFISEEEYQKKKLNIVSEPAYTIFKEDLLSPELFLYKIKSAFNGFLVSHDHGFDSEQLLQIRRDWEPDFKFDKEETTEFTTNSEYSRLTVYPGELSEKAINKIIASYFNGTKHLLFCDSRVSISEILRRLHLAFEERNIIPVGNRFEIGRNKLTLEEKNCYRFFNMEIYYVENLSEITNSVHVISEGKNSASFKTILDRLAKMTTFNKNQYDVEHALTNHNILVEAGAGTGKTTSMVSRIAYLCNKSENPVQNFIEEIAMVTFTNDAADNMKKKIKNLFYNYFLLTQNVKFLTLAETVNNAQISTIHKFALEILRKSPSVTGLSSNFTLASDEKTREDLYNHYLGNFLSRKESENENFMNELPVPIYMLKNKLMDLADKLLAKSVDFKAISSKNLGVTTENVMPFFNEAIEEIMIPAELEYVDKLAEINLLDLKHCIIALQHLLNSSNGQIPYLKYQYLFIDEFQDTDDIQIEVFKMLQKLMNSDCKFFIVGDLKQSIYRFRGAKLSAFLQLRDNSKFEWDEYFLNINYRTDRSLLNQYDEFFTNMGREQYLPYKPDKDRLIGVKELSKDDEQLFKKINYNGKVRGEFEDRLVETVSDAIQNLKKYIGQRSVGAAERSVAILVRTNWEVQQVVNILKEHNIKVDVSSGGDLFQLESTLDLYKLLLAVDHCTDPVYLVNLIESNYIRAKIDYAFMEGLSQEKKLYELTKILDRYCRDKTGLTWREILDQAYAQPVLFFLNNIFNAFKPWQKYSQNKHDQEHYIVNYEYLVEQLIRYMNIDSLTLTQVLGYLKVNILTNQKRLSRDIDVVSDGIRVLCTTVHKSKGLEYDTVILPFINRDISSIKNIKIEANYQKEKVSYVVVFEKPSGERIREQNSNYNQEDEISEQVSEEARILYVALTRAIRKMITMNDVDHCPAICWNTFLEV